MKLPDRVAKLEQIQQQAQLTLEAYPRHLTRERLRMIIALARQLRAAMLEDAQLARRSPELPSSRSSLEEGC
jgi:hypothetical protein